ncbi:MAG: family 43 glycosylhydrolase, partial [Bacteroidota bacterium]
MIYSGRGFKDWEIGDIEVIVHEGVYHLYHLIIPNHDYIAHAVSKDGINWRRVKNAIFVGDPGEWDDDMIWTMDVSPTKDGFVMYYTGLSMADEGKTQRVGRAYSSDLILWTKDDRGALVESQGPYYEDLTNNPRGWLSFRDPYQYSHEGQNYLLICGRASAGATHHRGCVTIVREEADGFQLLPPLLYPGLYDDVECPCLVHIKDRFYLLGSIREDIKVRYWHSKDFLGPYESFHSDMLMPGGNYAARVVQDGDHMLLYNFYFSNKDLNHKRVLPPPKELDVDVDGKLYMKTYYRWVDMITDTVTQDTLPNLESRLQNHTSDSDIRP